MRSAKHGDRVVIAKSSGAILHPERAIGEEVISTKTGEHRGPNRVIEVQGYTGKVRGAPYESTITGKQCACVEVDNGGGIAAVPVERLASEELRAVGHAPGANMTQERWDSLFPKRRRRTRSIPQ